MVDSSYIGEVNGLDLFFLLVILYLGIISALNGFIDELVSVVSIISATVTSYLTSFFVEDILLDYIDFPMAVTSLSYLGVFLGSLFVINRLLKIIFVRININRTVDILLGFLAGITKGLIIVALLIFVVNYIFPSSKQPKLFVDSKVHTVFTDIIYDLKDQRMTSE